MISQHRLQLIELGKKRGANAFVSAMESMPHIGGRRGNIVGISISPVKSLGMLNLRAARVGKRGLTINGVVPFEDRSFMIVREEEGQTERGTYSFVRFSQRECGKLVLARPSLKWKTISYHHPTRDVGALEIDETMLRPSLYEESVAVRLSKQSQEIVTGQLEKGPITEWVRLFLKKSGADIDISRIHVLREGLDFDRMVDPMHACGQEARTIYSDGGKVTVASMSTLAVMNQEFGRTKEREVSADAFRMNVLLTGLPPFAEYLIKRINIQSLTGRQIPLDFGGACVRCDVTRVDLYTGDKPDAQPLKWLKGNLPGRPDEPSKVTFGFNCTVPEDQVGAIFATGTTFTVSDEKE